MPETSQIIWDLKTILQIAAVVLVFVGWIVGHQQASKRDVRQKRREIRVRHLREAYLKLAKACDSKDGAAKHIVDIQAAFNDIQLFGDPKHIDSLKKFISEVNAGENASLNDLLAELRDEIRVHLKLSKIRGTRLFVRARSPEEIPDDGLPTIQG